MKIIIIFKIINIYTIIDMSNRKVIQENNNFKSKSHENRFNKKNKQSDIRSKRNNKNFFQYEDSIINELPSGSFDKNNKVHPESTEQNNENKTLDKSPSNELLEKKNDINLDDNEEEYEEYSPDYFESQVYKK
jgi:hypothetical protein